MQMEDIKVSKQSTQGDLLPKKSCQGNKTLCELGKRFCAERTSDLRMKGSDMQVNNRKLESLDNTDWNLSHLAYKER